MQNIRSTSELIEPLTLDADDPAACDLLTQTLRTYGLALVRTPEFDPGVRSLFLGLHRRELHDS